MIINMTTIAVRQTNYIDKTIESLLQSDGRDFPLNLILGSSDTSHVERYRGRFNIVPWDAESEAQARPDHMRANCNLNAIRSLKYGDDEHCLCIEDDINFVEDWYAQLMLTIAEIPDVDYLLNLGQGSPEPSDKRYTTHTGAYLCGAQAIFYPSKALRSAVATYVEQNPSGGMNDALVGQYAKKFAALYNTTPRLVGHIGQVSSFTQPQPPPKPVDPVVLEVRQAAPEPTPPPPPPPPREEKRTAPVAPQPPVAAPAPNPAVLRQIRQATSETFVALMRASLGSGALPDAANLAKCDWRDLGLLASHHGLVPAIYHAVNRQPAGVPPEPLKRLKGQYVTNVFHKQLARAAAEEIAAAFDGDRIRFIVTEGAPLLRDLYGDPGLGGMEHFGLLVEEGEVERANTLLQHLGYERNEAPLAGHHRRAPSQMHFGYHRPQAQSVPVELHWKVVEPYRPYCFDLDAVRSQAKPVGSAPSVLSMSPEHELALLCLRLESRAATYRSLIRQENWFDLLLRPRGPGRLGSLYDIALYLGRDGLIDWERFVDTARRWAIDERLHATLELARRAFDIGPPAEVLRELDRGQPQLAERLAHHVSFAADRAHEMLNQGSPSTRRSRGLARWSTPLLRAAHAWTSVFPPRAYLSGKYPGPGSSLALRARHVRDLLPSLWAEARYRLAIARRGAPATTVSTTVPIGEGPVGS